MLHGLLARQLCLLLSARLVLPVALDRLADDVPQSVARAGKALRQGVRDLRDATADVLAEAFEVLLVRGARTWMRRAPCTLSAIPMRTPIGVRPGARRAARHLIGAACGRRRICA